MKNLIKEFTKALSENVKSLQQEFLCRVELPRIGYDSELFRGKLIVTFINDIDVNLVKKVMNRLRKDMTPIEKALNVRFDYGRVTYTKSTFSFKLTVYKADKSGVDADELKGRKSLKTYGHRYELSEDDYGRELTGSDKKTYLLVGINPKATKNVLNIKDKKTGTVYSCSLVYVGLSEIKFF